MLSDISEGFEEDGTDSYNMDTLQVGAETSKQKKNKKQDRSISKVKKF